LRDEGNTADSLHLYQVFYNTFRIVTCLEISMSRWKAAAIHISVSIIVGLLSALLIFGVWYPQPYIQAAGADRLILLLLGVDITLGPLLTLIVFKSGKWGMRFDMTVIILAQICAFTYGMSVVVNSRPVYIVAAANSFSLVAASDLDNKDLNDAKDARFRAVPWTGPRVIGAVMPTDAKERSDLLFSGFAGKDVDKFPKYYVDYADIVTEFLKQAKTLAELKARHPEAAALLDDWLRQNNHQAGNVVWVSLQARDGTFTALLDAKTGDLLDVLPFRPW
jgi:hypothetical protein